MSKIKHPMIAFFLRPFNSYTLQFISVSQASIYDPNLVYDDTDIEYIRERAKEDLDRSNDIILFILVGVVFALLSLVLVNPLLMFVAIFMVIVNMPSNRKIGTWFVQNSFTKFPGVEGIYEITNNVLGYTRRVGVAYVKDGVVHSRLHVTGTATITFEGEEIQPSYVDENRDIITWGGKPVYVTPREGQKVVVEILPTYSSSTILYTTTAHTLDNGNVFFKGLKTLGGTSGSPYFLETPVLNEGETQPQYVLNFAGTIGQNLSSDYSATLRSEEDWQIEILAEGDTPTIMEYLPVHAGEWYQYFSYPGSGKTHTVVPQVVRDGLNVCSRVVVAGPTRVVAKELYNSLSTVGGISCSLLIKGDRKIDRTARVIITTHPSLLAMLHRSSNRLPESTGFIIDETHFANTKTLALLSYLRNRFKDKKAKGFLLELTATGYSFKHEKYIFQNGSQYPIEDHTFPSETPFKESVEKIIQKHKDARVIVFCPSVHGDNGVRKVANYLKSRYGDSMTIISLHRANYSTANDYIQRTMQQPATVIITTSISECGANYNVDVCIDSAKQLRFMRNGDEKVFRSQITPISRAQYVQRRGRVGRRREGKYYFPDNIDTENLIPNMHPKEAEIFDLMVYNRAANLENISEFETSDEGVLMNEIQLNSWITDSSEYSIANPLVFTCWHNKRGAKHTPEYRKSLVNELLRGTHAIKVQLKSKTIDLRVQAWDDRDRSYLLKHCPNVTKHDINSASESETEEVYEAPLKRSILSDEAFSPLEKILRYGRQRFNLRPEAPHRITVENKFLKKNILTEFNEAVKEY